MEEVKSKLRAELNKSRNVKILSEQVWALTTWKVHVSYSTVTKTKMDILMKMMLLAIQQMEIEHEEELAKLLGVENLFVNDLLHMMKTAGLVEYGASWSVTEKGSAQLETSMLIHETEDAERLLLFSALHQEFWNADKIETDEDSAVPYRYDSELSDGFVADSVRPVVREELSIQVQAGNTENRQVIVEDIKKITIMERLPIPCIEYHVYNTNEDTIYAKIWNTRTARWDEKLEVDVMDRERSAWKEQYEVGKENMDA